MQICWLCGQAHARLTEEHIVAQRWGGRLKTRTCSDCNRRAGRLEELAEEVPWVVLSVGRAGLRGRRRKLRAPVAKAFYPDGVEGTISYTTAGPQPRTFAPRLLGDEKTWEVPEELESLFRTRLAARGETFELKTRRVAKYEGAEVEYGLGPANILIWPRLAAKMALCCASLALDPTFVYSDGARQLQTFYVEGRWPGASLAPLPSELDSEHTLKELLDVDEHLLVLEPNPQGGALFAVVLFGAVQFVLPVPDADASKRPAWLLRAGVAAPPRPQSFDAILAALMLRAGERDPHGRWAPEP